MITTRTGAFLRMDAGASSGGAAGRRERARFRLQNPDTAPRIAHQIEQQAGTGFVAATWMEEQSALFRALRLERLVTAIFIGLITLVAGLNILVVLSMTVTDAPKILRCCAPWVDCRANCEMFFCCRISHRGVWHHPGLDPRLLLLMGRRKVSMIPLDPQVYAVPYVPFPPHALDGVLVHLLPWEFSLLATLVPPVRTGKSFFQVESLRI